MGIALQQERWRTKYIDVLMMTRAESLNVIADLKKKDVVVTKWAQNSIKWLQQHKPVPTERTVLNLVVISPANMGFHAGSRFYDFNRATERCGLVWCPAWAGVQYRIDQVGSQRKGEFIKVVSRPLPWNGKHWLMAVSNENARDRLSLVRQFPHWRCAPDELFLYRIKN
jgi:hypothetical protein